MALTGLILAVIDVEMLVAWSHLDEVRKFVYKNDLNLDWFLKIEFGVKDCSFMLILIEL